MKSLFFLIFIMTGSFSFASKSIQIVETGLTFEFRASPISNLFSQLDCMSEKGHCSHEAYRLFWKEKLGWTPKDDEALTAWDNLREGFYEDEIHISRAEFKNIGVSVGSQTIDLYQKRQMAALMADSLADLEKNLNLVMAPPELSETMKIFNHFYPRFKKWWTTSAEIEAFKFNRQVIDLMKKKKLFDLIGKIKRFYSPDLPKSQVVYFNALARPRIGDQHTFGEQISNFAKYEVFPGEPPTERIDVILHELFHFFYGSITPTGFASLVKGFTSSDLDYSISGFNLLNETLATALGNGLVYRAVHTDLEFEKLFKKSKSLYNDESIDRVAKGLIPKFDKWITNGLRIGDEIFTTEYLKTVDEALDQEKMSLANILRNRVIIRESSNQKSAEKLLGRLIRSTSTWSSEGLADANSFDRFSKNQFNSGVILVDKRGIEKLSSWSAVFNKKIIRELNQASKNTAFSYGIKLNSKAYVFLLIGSDEKSLLDLIMLFGDAQAKPVFEGMGQAI